jgi:hypothetical protein
MDAEAAAACRTGAVVVNKPDVQRCKASILRCLTEDFTYGTRKDGTPLKRPKHNQALFRRAGHQVFSDTDLTMVMDAVVLGLYLALDEERVVVNGQFVLGRNRVQSTEGPPK